jgi:hypothetical protein
VHDFALAEVISATIRTELAHFLGEVAEVAVTQVPLEAIAERAAGVVVSDVRSILAAIRPRLPRAAGGQAIIGEYRQSGYRISLSR